MSAAWPHTAWPPPGQDRYTDLAQGKHRLRLGPGQQVEHTFGPAREGLLHHLPPREGGRGIVRIAAMAQVQ